jgi:hypothetical protein
LVGVELQSFEKERTIECPATGIVAMSRVVELYVNPSAMSVGEVQIVCHFGDEVADASALELTTHPNNMTKATMKRTVESRRLRSFRGVSLMTIDVLPMGRGGTIFECSVRGRAGP